MTARSDLPADLETRIVAILESAPERQTAAIDALCAEQPDHAPQIRARIDAALQATGADPDGAAAAFAALAAQQRQFGPFRVLDQLARGGMGIVYLAEQTEPVRRRVALKVLDQRGRDPEFAARFAVERQALAMLQHPHIARVLDAGTQQGTPWLAIEFVASRQTITSWCDEQQLDVRARLELFLSVCDAVQHAHARGILHRDLKPANVLIDTSGRTPAPKVIDFGIAKLTGASDSPFATRAGALLGTSVFMSPEQARGELDLDTRTDVYALGGLLHELLTGEYPGAEHDLAHLFQRDLPRFLQIVTGVPLSPPSARARSPRFVRALRGDLDAIVLHAMAKQRERRYPSVTALADDIERHLRGEPVAARGSGAFYRLRKFAARHALALPAAAVVAAMAVAGALWIVDKNSALARANAQLAVRNGELEQERARAVTLQQDAERERNAALAARHDAEQARDAAGTAAAAATAAERTTAEQARRLRNAAAAADEARTVLADLLADESVVSQTTTIGDLAARLGTMLDERLRLWPVDVERELRRTTAWLLQGLGRHDDARAQFAVLAATADADDPGRIDRALALHALGDAVAETGSPQAACNNVDKLREAAAILRQARVDERDPRLLRVEGDLAFQLMQTGRPGDFGAGQELMVGCLRRTLGLENDVIAVLRVTDALTQLRRDTRKRGFDAAVEQLDAFLAPVLSESLLAIRLCDILLAASTYPQLKNDRELILRCALRYGERLNGRGHPHTTRARLDLVVTIAGRKGAAADATSRAELFRLVAQQADIDAGGGRRRDLTGFAREFAAKVTAALAAAAPAEFARLGNELRADCRADNPMLALLADLGSK